MTRGERDYWLVCYGYISISLTGWTEELRGFEGYTGHAEISAQRRGLSVGDFKQICCPGLDPITGLNGSKS